MIQFNIIDAMPFLLGLSTRTRKVATPSLLGLTSKVDMPPSLGLIGKRDICPLLKLTGETDIYFLRLTGKAITFMLLGPRSKKGLADKVTTPTLLGLTSKVVK